MVQKVALFIGKTGQNLTPMPQLGPKNCSFYRAIFLAPLFSYTSPDAPSFLTSFVAALYWRRLIVGREMGASVMPGWAFIIRQGS
jgi:hypothetical protein